MGIGDWGLGIGDWGLGIGPNPQSLIPNPQSPIPNLKIILKKYILFINIKVILYFYKIYYIRKIINLIITKYNTINKFFVQQISLIFG